MARQVPIGWPGSQIYIHFHEENARRAAGIYGENLYSIRSNATSAIKAMTGQRFSQSVFAGKNPNDIKRFANEITRIEDAISDTQAVTDYLNELLAGSMSDENNITYAATVSNKISTMIGGISKTSNNSLTNQIAELLDLVYGVDLNTLISMKANSPTKIGQAQYQNLLQLQKVLNGSLELQVTDKRNLLVDIFTEQGLPDFLERCVKVKNDMQNDLIQSAIHLGSERIVGSSAKGKIDTSITFNIPVANKIRTITQGISIKSNYFGMAANILSTSFSSTLKYANSGGDMEAQVNAISLMDTKWLSRWLVWANLDRALQGTSKALQSEYNLQDRADMLIEFTGDGFQVYNLNDILYRLATKINDLNVTDLGNLGFGTRQTYNIVKRYDRSRFTNYNEDTVKERAEYSNAWLTATHIIVVDVHKMIAALRK